jgi:hypothetical protein
MPSVTGALTPDGAVIPILLGLSASSVQALRTALRPVPSPAGVRALIDTGAELTCVDTALIQTLGLTLGGTTLANLPAHGGLTVSALHDASLTIVHPSGKARANLVVLDLAVLSLPLAPLGYQALLGRDLLARCRFLYDGPRDRFRLSY